MKQGRGQSPLNTLVNLKVFQNLWTKVDPEGLYVETEAEPIENGITQVRLTFKVFYKSTAGIPTTPEMTAKLNKEISEVWSGRIGKFQVQTKVVDLTHSKMSSSSRPATEVEKEVARDIGRPPMTTTQIDPGDPEHAQMNRYNIVDVRGDFDGTGFPPNAAGQTGIGHLANSIKIRENSAAGTISHEAGHAMGVVEDRFSRRYKGTTMTWEKGAHPPHEDDIKEILNRRFSDDPDLPPGPPAKNIRPATETGRAEDTKHEDHKEEK